jgi:hypothetical protein
MTEAIREYIKGLSKEKLRDCLHECDAIYMSKKKKHPYHEEFGSAVFHLVGNIEEIDPGEDALTIKDKVTITAIEFWDWGILEDLDEDEDDEENERTEEQMQKLVADAIYELLDIRVGDYEHAYYESIQGVNLYRAPLKTPIILLRTEPLLRPEGTTDEEVVEVTLVAEG